MPFWKGDGVGRPKELGQAIGAFSRWAVDQAPETLQADYDLDAFAAKNLLDFLLEQQAATRVMPSDRTIVVERFRDEIGDWRLCVLSPYGGRVHAAWGLALSRRIRERYGLESDAIWSDDGIIVHLPDADEPPGAELVMVEPDEVQEAVVAELASSALFGARFRENAGRALLIPRAYPGKRTPLWQQRLKSQSLLEVAKRYPDFPIILETYRECLRDVLDVPGLEDLLRGLHSRELSLVEVETPTASPFASSLLFDYVATYMYEGDAPNAERRAAALSLDRELLRELLGQEELRELIDVGALDMVEDDLQHRSDRTRAETRDALADVLRRVGDLTVEEVHDRVLAGIDADRMLETLRDERRAIVLRIGGEPRWVAADDAGLYRDALGAVPPGGLPDAFTADVPDALAKLVARYARTHGPFTTAELRARYGVDPTAVLERLERDGEIVRGELHPRGRPGEPEWCDTEVLRRLRRASLAALRKEIEPADQRALAAFLPSWQGVDRHPAAGAGIDRLREVLVPLQGLALPAEVWERDVLPRRVGAYSPTWLDQLCASRRGRLGRRRHARAHDRARRAVLPRGRRGDRPCRRRRAARGAAVPSEPEHELVRERLLASPCFFTDLLADVALEPEQVQEALWDLVWAGEVTNDAFAPLRAPRLTLARARHGGAAAPRRGPALRHPPQRRARGRPGPLGADRHDLPPRAGAAASAAARSPSCCSSATASSRASRCSPRASPAASRSSTTRCRSSRRSASAAAATSSRGSAARSSRCPARSSGCARSAPSRSPRRSCSPRPTRRSPTARRCLAATRDRRRGARASPRACAARTSCSPAPSRCSTSRRAAAGSRRSSSTPTRASCPAFAALAEFVTGGRGRKLSLERVDGEPVVGSPLESLLIEVGFRAGPSKLTLSA